MVLEHYRNSWWLFSSSTYRDLRTYKNIPKTNIFSDSVNPTQEDLPELNLDEINSCVGMSDEELLNVLFPELHNICD
jgi:hypothetical protein